MREVPEDEIKRTIHVRLQAIVDRAKSEYADAQIEYAQSKAAKEEADRLAEDDFSGGWGINHYEVRLKQAIEKRDKAPEAVQYWNIIRDWADDRLIGPLTPEAARN